MAMGMSTWARHVAASSASAWHAVGTGSSDSRKVVVDGCVSSARSCPAIARSCQASSSSSSLQGVVPSFDTPTPSTSISKIVRKNDKAGEEKIRKSIFSDLLECASGAARGRAMAGGAGGGRRVLLRPRAAMAAGTGPPAGDSDPSFASRSASPAASASDSGGAIATLHNSLSSDEDNAGEEVQERRSEIRRAITESLSRCLTATSLDGTVPAILSKKEGKVRDMYDAGKLLVIVTTDRQSAFDRVLASVPFKGQVLNETSGWWFDNTKHIVPNAALCRPDPNVTIFRKCSVFPIEFVVRGYITGTTSTSLWTVYNAGKREYCGNVLPEGLVKNDKLEKNILTPTTKAEDHDVPISPHEIVRKGLMTKEDMDYLQSKALSLFAYGQEVAAANGLLLVDTKYEFGRAPDGTIMLVDEIHTPDSSRYWIASSYAERHTAGLEPESIDKEFLRLWFKQNCDPYNDEVLPDAPTELVTELSSRYITLYEMITGNAFKIPNLRESIHDRMARNVDVALSSLRVAQL